VRQTVARILLVAAVALPLAIVGIGALVAWRDIWDAARRDLTREADATAEYAERVLGSHRLAAALVNHMFAGLSDAEIRAREPELHEQLKAILPSVPMALTIALSDRDAVMLLTANVHPVPRVSIADREWVRELGRSDPPAVHVSSVTTGRVDNNFFFGVSIRRSGTGNGLPGSAFDGVINVSVSPVQLAAGLEANTRAPSDVMALVRDDGEVLARYPAFGARLPPIGTDSPLRLAATAGERRGIYTGASLSGRPPHVVAGEPLLIAFRRLDQFPVYATASRPRATIVASWQKVVWGQLAVGVPAAAILAGLALLVLRGQRRLAASEADFRSAFERTTIGMVQMDAVTCRLLRVNDRFCGIVGRTRAELLADMTFLDLTHLDDRDSDGAGFCAAMVENQEYAAEQRLLRPDGSAVWVRINVALIADAGKAGPRAVAAVQDITERRAAEASQTLLMREVDHRAKNSLAVVQSILALTKADDPGTFLKVVQGRVAALARAHTLLAEARWEGADLRTLISEEVAPFADGSSPRDARVVLDGESVSLAAGTAQPLAMALHELVTNAAKHGALSQPEGRVRVSWSRDSVGSGLRLDWVESGGPPVLPPQRSGFGTAILDATVRRQIGGDVERCWDPAGLRCSIHVPIQQIQAGQAAAPAAD
jgi:PAS domain S-box-containing protein